MNFTDGVEVRRFCGLPVSETDGTLEMCVNEADGDVTFLYEDEGEISVPICSECFLKIQNEYGVDLAGENVVE